MDRPQPLINENLFCCLCYAIYSDTQRPASLRTCDDHIFCEQCLINWTNRTCPLCRIPYTLEDIKVERKFFEVVKSLFNNLRLTDEQALRIQVRQRFKSLEPSLENLIFLKKSISTYYQQAIDATNHSLWTNGSSMALKSLAAGFCFFPATAPIGILAMGVTSVTDIGQNLFFGQQKKGIYCGISDAILKHDQILHDDKVKQCFDLYHELQKITFIQHLMKGEAQLEHHLNPDSCKLVSSGIHGAATVVSGVSFFNIGEIDFSGFISGKGSGEWAKMQRSIGPLAKSTLIVAIVAEWGLFFYDMKKGSANKEELIKKIEETENSIKIYENFLKLSQKNEI